MTNRMMTHRKQSGAILPIVSVSLTSLLMMAGIATDLSHLYVEKTRLQNALDGAALRGAYVFTLSNGSVSQTRTAVFDTLASGTANGSSEFNSLFDSANVVITFPTINGINLVKLNYTTLTIPTLFLRVLGFNTLTTGGSAMAGPVPLGNQVCNVAPLIVCGDTSKTPPNGYYGYTMGQEYSLSTSSWKSNDIGPGNFGYLNIDGKGGANLRENLAGGGSCLNIGPGTPVDTKPGNTKGPASQGINTRFGEYKGPVSETDYPPDWVTTENISYATYRTDYTNINPLTAIGKPNRRILIVPIGDCNGGANGDSSITVLGFGCFFLTQKYDNGITGEFVGGCEASGTPGPGTVGSGPYKIVLYRDTSSPDS